MFGVLALGLALGINGAHAQSRPITMSDLSVPRGACLLNVALRLQTRSPRRHRRKSLASWRIYDGRRASRKVTRPAIRMAGNPLLSTRYVSANPPTISPRISEPPPLAS